MLAKFYTSNLNDTGRSANFGVVIEPRGPDNMVVEITLSEALPEKQWVLVPNKEIEFVDFGRIGEGEGDEEFNVLYDKEVSKILKDIDSPTEIN